jgi:diguanylate cyclase (GGDEF)-like protein
MAEDEPTNVQFTGRPDSGEAKPCVVVLTGKKVGVVVKLRPQGTVVGRAVDTDLVLDDDGVSRVHCMLLLEDGRWMVRDLGSTNGTFVGERTVGNTPLALREGDRIRLGTDVILRFGTQDAIERQFLDHLYRSATRDALTGVSNRRLFSDRLESELAWHRRHEAPLSLLFVDIDHFKRINDTYGHARGDDVLRAVADLLEDVSREEDTVARWGGEEFVVLLRQTPSENARRVAERLRRFVSRFDFGLEGSRGDQRVTVSVGVATRSGDELTTASDLVSEADAMLYLAKGRGRNRVIPDPPDDS